MQSQESMFEEPEPTPAHPINNDPREQPPRQITLPDRSPIEANAETYHEYSEGYNGEGYSEGRGEEGSGEERYSEEYHLPYAEPGLMEGEKLRPRQRPMPKKRSVARPLAVLLLIVALMIAWGGFSHTHFNDKGYAWPHHSHSHFDGDGAQGAAPAQSFLVTSAPTLVVNGGNASIHIHAGNTNSVLVSTSDGAPVQSQQNGNTIDVGSVDSSNALSNDDQNLDITVPVSSNLEIHTSGDIQVEGVDGQMTLNTDNGDVQLEHTLLRGDTSIKSTEGDITVQGAIDSQGSYQFQTDSGDVKLSLPEHSSFHLTSTTDSGSVNNGFEGSQASKSSGPQLNISTDSGDISVQPQDD